MGKRLELVKTEDCPCQGEHAWIWHQSRGLRQCEHSRALKYGNYLRWADKVGKEKERIRKVLSEDPAGVPWIAGASIYLDEEEHTS